jgi:hypothetical protein
MPWSVVTFGEHKGKTLPQLIFSDPDWFFWAMAKGESFYWGKLKQEAAEIDRRARRIRIPNNKTGIFRAEYIVHAPTGKFGSMQIVPADQPAHEGSSPTFRMTVIDLSVPRKIAPYDKLGCKNLISSVKCLFFGGSKTTQKLCETFFDKLENFEL